MVVRTQPIAAPQISLPNFTGPAWALFAIVLVIIVGALVAMRMAFKDTEPKDRPEIIREMTEWMRAVGDAVRPFRRREKAKPSPRPRPRTPPPPAASVTATTAQTPEKVDHERTAVATNTLRRARGSADGGDLEGKGSCAGLVDPGHKSAP